MSSRSKSGSSSGVNAARPGSFGNSGSSGRQGASGGKEKGESKLWDLLSYGVKPWDPDAKEFYEALQEARREVDRQQQFDDKGFQR